VQRVSDGQDVQGSPWRLDPAPSQPEQAGGQALRACLERATRDGVAGWAWDESRPGERLALQVLDNGAVIARVLANAYRADLAIAGIGDGRYAFEVRFPGGLPAQSRHVLSVRFERDGADIENSPAVIAPATSFDGALEQAVAQAVAALDGAGEQDRVLSFLAAQMDRLLQQRAEAEGERSARLADRQLRRRWEPLEMPAAPAPGLRALVVDDGLPDPERDSASVAILSHMRALQGLGYTVSFAAAQGAPPRSWDVTLLERLGITVCRAPYYASVEEVLRRQAQCFDVIYLHRIANASSYLSMARRHHPQARILYGVGELRHVCVAGQAAVEQRPELLAESRRLRLLECTAAWSADAVLTHSAAEAALLQQAVPTARIHVVPWAVPVQPALVPVAQRRGIAFIGHFGHAANADAARFLAEAVMPLVWQSHPKIECVLAGRDMPDAIRGLARPGLAPIGGVPKLSEVFDRVRLTVAPQRYGAGVKGAVLNSFAAGLPCVMSPAAAEGIALPAPLQNLVGADAAELAAEIIRLHAGRAPYRRAADAGLSMIAAGFKDADVAEALKAAIDGRHQPMLLATG
jgi:hypothetical protein